MLGYVDKDSAFESRGERSLTKSMQNCETPW